MDTVHQDHLARILENRRRRGATAAGGLAHSRSLPPVAERSKDVVELEETTSHMHASPPASPEAHMTAQASSQAPQSPPRQEAPHRTPSPNYIEAGMDESNSNSVIDYGPPAETYTTTTTVVSRNEVTLLLESQRQLQFHQALQEKKVDSLSENIERNFATLQNVMALNGMASASLAPHKRASPARGGATGLNTSPGLSRPQSSGEHTPSTYHSASRQMVPVSPAAGRNSRVATTADRFVPLHGVPQVARPQPKTTLDPKSSINIMRTGDWFLKWNAKWTRAEARYVWLDATRYELLWGRERLAKSIFSDAIELENITSVTTDQVTEFDGEVNRLFYLLRVHAQQRSLVLATEKREKLDWWYEAISTVVLFYKGQRMARSGAVSSD